MLHWREALQPQGSQQAQGLWPAGHASLQGAKSATVPLDWAAAAGRQRGWTPCLRAQQLILCMQWAAARRTRIMPVMAGSCRRCVARPARCQTGARTASTAAEARVVSAAMAGRWQLPADQADRLLRSGTEQGQDGGRQL